MSRLRCAMLVFGIVLVTAASTSGQDKKPDKDDPAPKVKLPAYWSKLGLSEEQKEKYYKVHATYTPKIAELEKKLADLKTELKDEENKILTEQQKAHYRELKLGEKPEKDKPATDKEPAKDKPAEPAKDKPADKDKSTDKDKAKDKD
jgi:hypothetical protein